MEQISWRHQQPSECSLAQVATKVQEEMDSDEAYVLLTNKGKEIMDSNATKGRRFIFIIRISIA